jgi:hypothetical protein
MSVPMSILLECKLDILCNDMYCIDVINPPHKNNTIGSVSNNCNIHVPHFNISGNAIDRYMILFILTLDAIFNFGIGFI